MKIASGMPMSIALSLMMVSAAVAASPTVGEKAPEFTLKTPAGETVKLASLNAKGPVVLVVLRGWPGYQCPLCTRQVAELVGKAKQMKEANAHVVLVYPGPADGLIGHADEFIRGKSLPDNFEFVVDPDYAFTKSYDLRWNAKNETAYPSTFVINAQGTIAFAKTSRSHGDRARTDDVIGALEKK